MRERVLQGSAPARIDEHDPGEQVPERRLEPRHARVHEIDEGSCARRHELRLGRRGKCVDHEQEPVRVTLVETFHRRGGGIAAPHDNRAHGITERGGDRSLGAGVDLEQVDQWADHAVDISHVLDPRGRTSLAEAEIERIGPRPPPRRFGFGGAPLLVDRAQRRVGIVESTGPGGDRRERRVGALELGVQRARVGNERLDHAFVGRGRELAVDPPTLLGHEGVEPAGAFTHRLDAHERVGERVVAHRAERVLGLEHGDIERAEPLAQFRVTRALLRT